MTLIIQKPRTGSSFFIDTDISSLYPNTINITANWKFESRSESRKNKTHTNFMNQKDWEHNSPSGSVAMETSIPDFKNYPKDRAVLLDMRTIRKNQMTHWCDERDMKYRIELVMNGGFQRNAILFKRSTDAIAFIMYWADEE